ncbi:MAG: hypothetical protein MJ162_03160 [Treponema sp.]|nr:hypothetical protein [Treponema sp.]
MEELRSTDILDKEIQADARRKAESILKKADEEAEKIKKGVAERVEASKKEKEAFYAKKLASVEKDMNATIPLEKERFAVTFIQKEMIANINAYLKSLPVQKRIELVFKAFDKNLLSEKKLNAYVYGFDLSEVQKKLKDEIGSNLLKCEKTDFGKYVLEDEIGLECNEGIILETEDKTFRVRLTMVQIINNLLDKNRMELSNALFGGNL